MVDALEVRLEAFAAAKNIDIDTLFPGSIPALNAMEDGRAEIGLIAVPPAQGLPEIAYHLIPFTYLATFVLVNPDNGIDELSLPQLQGIFAANPVSRIERWGQLGMEGPLMTRSIQTYIGGKSGSLIVEMFKSEALDRRSLKSSVTLLPSASDVSAMVSADMGVIGVSSHPGGLAARAVPISTGQEGSFAFGPTPENIYYGDYPLRLPFYIVIPKQAKLSEYRDIIEFLLSNQVAEALTREGFVSLPENIRKRTLRGLDIDL